MPQLRHIALTTHDVEGTAKFYIEVFGMKEMGKINDGGTTGCFLSELAESGANPPGRLRFPRCS